MRQCHTEPRREERRGDCQREGRKRDEADRVWRQTLVTATGKHIAHRPRHCYQDADTGRSRYGTMDRDTMKCEKQVRNRATADAHDR